MVHHDALERGCDVRHACPVSILSFRHDVIACLRRPLGRLAVFALMLMLVIGGAPAVEIHAHEAPADEHAQIDAHADHVAVDHHDAHFADTGGGDTDHPDTTTIDTPGDSTLLHAHDACASASSLPETSRLALVSGPASSPEAAPIVLPAVASRLTAPHRPPIV